MNEFTVSLAGVPLRIAPRFETTERFFPGAVRRPPAGAPSDAAPPISIPEGDWAGYLAQGFADAPATEYSLLTEYCSDALLAHRRMIVHGVALNLGGRAFLICGPSGVGKSTQAKHLQALRPGAFTVISGDRPVLEFCGSSPAGCDRNAAGTILVHPSPWNGKEGWHGGDAAPLAGLVLLERGAENRLETLTPQEAALPFYLDVIHSSWQPDNIRRVCANVTRLLRAVPPWRLVTHQVPASTQLLLDHIFSS